MLDMQVDGMHCEHCVRAVRGAVAAVAGVEEVQVDLASGRVRVAGSPDPAAVRAAIEDEGYTVSASG